MHKRITELIKNFPCWLHHNWTAWSKPFSFGYTAYQYKECEKCGKRKQRQIGWKLDN